MMSSMVVAFFGKSLFASVFVPSLARSTTTTRISSSFTFFLRARSFSTSTLMARLSSDPSQNVCPNYADEAFALTRAQLINQNIDEAQSIQMLINIWEAGKNAAKLQWQAQLEEDDQHEEEQQRQDQERLEEQEITRKEDRNKYTPVPDRDVPTEATILPSSYAIKKLDKGEYVELWYFTNPGLDDIHLKTTIDEDAMVMTNLPGGSTAWVSAASARNSRSVIEDKDLSSEDFCQACPRIVVAMGEAAWPADHIKMMALFFRNLQAHEYRSMRDPLAQKALLLYQSEQRKRWHLAVKTAAGAYDLSRINNELLERTRTRVYFDDREKKDTEIIRSVSYQPPF